MKKLLLGATLGALLMTPAPSAAKRHSLLLSFGQDVLVAKNGAVSVRAQCLANEGGLGSDVLRVYAASASNAVLRSPNSFPGDGSYLTAVTPPESALISEVSETTGQE